ncbi:hypothetical protein CI109_102356 [Kwoniella shandongensis]|uniref:Uncharacterized protein n=1 Tax=Kwoniella shandongensis TaxID=1734106 RepID=A0A5M6BZW1_9TREE|nr:uncharacterized protein CI109_003326 [Kwoniella shandongensis]KAA5528426.1 hypothetical protein CI109_003326 [Kwoniella shandongensis]
MRTTFALTALLVSASVALAVPTAVNSDQVDKKVASYDTPKHFHQDCDEHNVQCKALNNNVYGGANYVEGSIGKQVGQVASTGSQIATIENQPDLAHTLTTNGPVLQHDLQGRAAPARVSAPVPARASAPSQSPAPHGQSEANEALKQAGNDLWPAGMMSGLGNEVEKQGKAMEVAAKGVNAMSKETNKEMQHGANAEHKSGAEMINAIVG